MVRKFLLAALFLVFTGSCVTTDPTANVELSSGDLIVKRIPDRPSSAPIGAAFVSQLKNLTNDARERAILAEVEKGNMPSFLRRFRPVKLTLQQPGKKTFNATIWVSPDYVSIGSDKNYVRVPMNPVTAQKIADRFGCMLPTTKLVDAIYEQADFKLTPKPMQAGSSMVTTDYFWRHNMTIESQLHGFTPGKLLAGHKKDVVVTNKLKVQPTRVAIYGWHTSPKHPIQPLSLVHGYRYADYSHGIRLVSQYMQIDGKAVFTGEILKDPALAGLLSNEGALSIPRIRTELLSSAQPKPYAKSQL